MKRAALFVALPTVVFAAAGCSKLVALAKDKDTPPEAAAPVAATATATTATAATSAAPPTPTTTAKLAAVATAVAKNAKAALAIPSPTTDRIPRNRDKDGPCPAGFVEEPGAENHSTCARSCKTDANCHAHTCVDSDVGDGKVCSEIASKTPAASAARPPALKCKANELEDNDHCAKICSNDKDCAKGQKCVQFNVPNPNGGSSVNFICD